MAKDELSEIYLQPWCHLCAERSEYCRDWCDHDAWGPCECGRTAERYLHEDHARAIRTAVTEAMREDIFGADIPKEARDG